MLNLLVELLGPLGVFQILIQAEYSEFFLDFHVCWEQLGRSEQRVVGHHGIVLLNRGEPKTIVCFAVITILLNRLLVVDLGILIFAVLKKGVALFNVTALGGASSERESSHVIGRLCLL